MATSRVRVGTSGWSYDHWGSGVFYPEGLPPAGRLEFYASRFDTVEIDATFYRLPSEHAVFGWRDAVPDGFVFSAKGSRLITHYRRLAEVDEALDVYLRRMSLLGDKLAVVLWQLPPTLRAHLGLLGGFLERLDGTVLRHAIEFRHESWLAEKTFDLLREHNVAHVHVSSDAMPENLAFTADFVYVRFHGTAEYHGAYSEPALEPWVRFLAEQVGAGRDVYAYFNNDSEGHAPSDATRLLDMLGGEL